MVKAIPINKYISIKNNYCLCYYGTNKEYLVQLKLLRPIIEKTYKGLSIYICCPDNCMSIFSEEKNVFPKSDISNVKENVSYTRVIQDSFEIHPIEQLLEESCIKVIPLLVDKKNTNSKKCALLTNGNFPVRSLSWKQINTLENKFLNLGYEIVINPGLEQIKSEFEIVVGVENSILYEAAAYGIKTFLVPTGIGENLFLSMFPENELINVPN